MRIAPNFICSIVLAFAGAVAAEPLANENKEGLRVRSIEQVLRLEDQQVDLATAALIISERWSDMVYGRRYLTQLDEMAIEIRRRLADKNLKPNFTAIPVINEYLFDELQFKPVREANDPNDLFLHTVLDKKQGYCLSLSVLYLAIGERLGLPLYGVVVPGHFFVRYDDTRVKFNIETVGKGGSLSDDYYRQRYNVPAAGKNNIYMKSLAKIETLGCFFNNLGIVYSDVGSLDSAMQTLLLAVEINPTLSESRSSLGNVYLKKGQLLDAINQYQAALEINPHDPKTRNNLGNAYADRGWLNYAVNEYLQALEIDPNLADAHRNLARAYCKQKRYGNAISQLNHLLTIKPQEASCYSQLGDVYAQKGDHDQAVAQYKKAIAIKPDLLEANFGLGQCYNKLDMIDEEIQAYKNALTSNPNAPAVLIGLGNAYFKQQKYTSAIEYYGQAAAIQPNDAAIHYNIGAAYFNTGIYDRAVAAYQKAVELNPDLADAHYGLAVGYYQLKKFDLAWKHINIAKRLGAKVPKQQFDAIKSKAN
jgi:tetratricopeptide (TPR) repeat protein